VADHVGVEMAALAGIDLHGAHAGRPDAFGVAAGLLVAFDDGDRQRLAQSLDRPTKQRCLARTGAGNEIECEDAVPLDSKMLKKMHGITTRSI
jgi:hypothetical protein